MPATRNPVSSKCATSAQMSALVIAARAGLRYPATRRAIAARVPGEACTPNSSASAWRARSRDRNCPCHKYAPIPETRGPYCTAAVTPCGAWPGVTVPQPQRRAIS